MAAKDIRVAWDKSAGRLCALHPDDASFGPGAVEFEFADPADITPRQAELAGDRLLIGPTLGEIAARLQEA